MKVKLKMIKPLRACAVRIDGVWIKIHATSTADAFIRAIDKFGECPSASCTWEMLTGGLA